jgi:hypothetical protein
VSDTTGDPGRQEVPTFTDCVVGYRAWHADTLGHLWPIGSRRRPWLPGINTARCNCGTAASLRFEWSWCQGRRVLEPAPAHAAPDRDCTCGFYSWRRPRQSWYEAPGPGSPLLVVGAIASWGHLQVHRDGFRAEHACVVTLAYHPGTHPDALKTLGQIAARYRVELVPLAELEQAASRHGTPIPDSVGPPPGPPAPAELPEPNVEVHRVPDATVEEVGSAPPKIGFDGKPLPKPIFEGSRR